MITTEGKTMSEYVIKQYQGESPYRLLDGYCWFSTKGVWLGVSPRLDQWATRFDTREEAEVQAQAIREQPGHGIWTRYEVGEVKAQECPAERAAA